MHLLLPISTRTATLFPYTTRCRSNASVAVGLGMVFVNTDQHQLFALNQGTGAVIWSANTSPGATSQESSPSIAFGKVYVGSDDGVFARSEEHTSELQSLMRISYAVFCLKKKHIKNIRYTLLH